MLGWGRLMKFEWDEKKNEINVEKHGISFKEAETVFYDSHWLKITDEEHTDRDATEDRFYALGKSLYKNVLVVCYCERENDTIRIYSARVAKKSEKEVYNAYI